MVDPSIVDGVLSELRLIASLSFTINLGYLNLDRLRHQKIINESADEALRHLDSRNQEQSSAFRFKELRAYRDIKSLSNWHMDNDPVRPQEGEQNAQPSSKSLYVRLFSGEWDRKICRLSWIFSFLVICVGTSHSISLLNLEQVDKAWPGTILFFVQLISVVLPLFFSWTGSRYVIKTKDKIQSDFADLEETMKEAAQATSNKALQEKETKADKS